MLSPIHDESLNHLLRGCDNAFPSEALLSAVLAAITDRGYFCSKIAVGYDQFRALACALGDVVGTHDVQLNPRSGRLVSRKDAIPFHNDCSAFADFAGWYCIDPGVIATPTQFMDTKELLRNLGDEDIEKLTKVKVKEPGRPVHPLLSARGHNQRFYYLPWFITDFESEDIALAFCAFQTCIAQRTTQPVLEIALAAGEFCFVDDARLLHGRKALSYHDTRHLKRVWIERK